MRHSTTGISLIILIFSLVEINHGNKILQTTLDNDTHNYKDITNIQAKILVSVGQPWNDCNATVASDYLNPDQNFTTAPDIAVGDCDHGPLFYNVQQDSHTKQLIVTITFGTHSFSATPPSCQFKWKGGYLNPTNTTITEYSPLPGCSLYESDEGYHPTHFLFQLLTWQWF